MKFPPPSIIPYQVITGNYSFTAIDIITHTIIPYQVITGNYSTINDGNISFPIIPYQVITGNYSVHQTAVFLKILYHTK